MCIVVVVVERLNQSVLTTMGSGLQGPQGPFSPCEGLGPSFYIRDSGRRIERVYTSSSRFIVLGGYKGR